MARGKPKDKIRLFFNAVKTKHGVKVAQCPHCKWESVINVTRLSDHLLNKCGKVTSVIRSKVEALDNAKKKKKGTLKQTRLLPRKRHRSTYSDSASSCSSEGMTEEAFGKVRGNTCVQNKDPAQPGLKSFVDQISKEEQERLAKLYARAVYASGMSFLKLQHPAWKDFFLALRPSFQQPSRFDLAGPLLIQEYDALKTKIDVKIAEAESLAISLDGWSNVRRESIMNVILHTPEPVFLKSIECGSDAHTAPYVAGKVKDVMEDNSSNKFVAFASDNASNMKGAGKLVENEYPYVSWYGCMMHCLNLMADDLYKQVVKIKEIIDLCARITLEIKNKPKILAIFRDKQKLVKTTVSLQLPGKTRFGSNVRCIKNILENQAALRALAIDSRFSPLNGKPEIVLPSDIKKKILSDEFWSDVQAVLKILQPINKWLFAVQSNTIPFSQVLIGFKEIDALLEDVLKQDYVTKILSEQDKRTILKIVSDRKEFCLKPIHYVATLLDPVFKDSLSPNEKTASVAYLDAMATAAPDIDAVQLMEEYIDFSTRKNSFAAKHLWRKTSRPAHAWWKAFAMDTELCKIACRTLVLPPTTAAVERSFSAQRIVHCKLRNRLSNAKVEKLVYIQENLRLICKKEGKTKSSSADKVHVPDTEAVEVETENVEIEDFAIFENYFESDEEDEFYEDLMEDPQNSLEEPGPSFLSNKEVGASSSDPKEDADNATNEQTEYYYDQPF